MSIITHPAITGIYQTSDFYYRVSKGDFTGLADGINYSGYQSTNTLGVEADIWSGVTGNRVWLQAATSLEVVSSDVNDTANGTGARSVTITGLDINLNPITDTVAMNGTTPVAIPTQYFRVLRGFVASTGTYAATSNLGTITIRVAGAGATQAVIPIGAGRVAQTHYTVPAGKTFLLRSVTMNCEATKSCTFKIYIKGALPVTAPYSTRQLGLTYFGVQGGFTESFIHQVALVAGTDIWATATPGANNTFLSFDLQGIQVQTQV